MEKLEAEKERLTAILSNGETSNDELMEAGTKIGEVVSELEVKTDRWLELSEFI